MNSKAETHEEKYITSPEEFINEMAKYSNEFKDAMKNNRNITVKLHSCYTGGFIDPKGKSVKEPIAMKISKKYPNITVIAPTGNVYIDST